MVNPAPTPTATSGTGGDRRRLPAPRGHRHCRRCNKVVSRRALVCVRCGKRQRLSVRSRLLLGLGGALVIGMFTMASSGGTLSLDDAARVGAPAPQARPAETTPPPPVPASDAVQVTAAALVGEYGADAAAADRRYKDKRVAVTGTLRSSGRDFHGRMVLRLGGGAMFEAVQATLTTGETRRVAALVKGQAVSVVCVGRGALIGAPVLADCVLQ